MSAAENKAVFLSYASQDAEAAQRICEALRAAGVEVWFDQSELRGGDAWDQKIRKQIKECALFVPVISANTQARLEGYFRLEWKLAAQRTHTMAEAKPFLVPVCIDDTRDVEAHVPEEFRAVQWTRFFPADGSLLFCDRIKLLLTAGVSVERNEPPQPGRGGAVRSPASARRRAPWVPWAMAGIGGLALAAIFVWPKRPAPAVLPNEVARSDSRAGEKVVAPLSEVSRLTLQARALVDDDWLAGRENHRMAAELCEQATKLDATAGEAWATWARVSLKMISRRYDSSPERREAARVQADRAMRLAPESIETGLAVAMREAANGRRADAAQRVRALLARAPNDVRVVRLLADCVARAEASELRLSHPAFAGRDPRPLIDEAQSLYGAQRFGEAEALCVRAVSLPPCYETYYLWFAYTVFITADFTEAQGLVNSLPSQLLQEDMIAGISWAYWIRVGQPEKALAALRRAPRDYLEDGWYTEPKGIYAGWALQMSGRQAAAEAEWKQALVVVEKRLSERPNDASALLSKATLLALTGQKAEAEKNWQLSKEFGRQSKANLGTSRARLHLALGETEEAIRELQAALVPVTNGDTMAKVNMVRFEPIYASIRDDARIQRIIAEAEAALRTFREKKTADGAER